MARRRKKRRSGRRRTTRRSAPKKDKSLPAGGAIGGAVSLYKVTFERTPANWASPIDQLTATAPLPDKIKNTLNAMGQNVADLNKSGWVLGGLAVDYLKPKKVSKLIRKLTRGRLS